MLIAFMLFLLQTPMREPSWDRPTHFHRNLPDARVSDHYADYRKPRPARWWEWHCEICNAPDANKP